jgi:hypothetical protein
MNAFIVLLPEAVLGVVLIIMKNLERQIKELLILVVCIKQLLYRMFITGTNYISI